MLGRRWVIQYVTISALINCVPVRLWREDTADWDTACHWDTWVACQSVNTFRLSRGLRNGREWGSFCRSVRSVYIVSYPKMTSLSKIKLWGKRKKKKAILGNLKKIMQDHLVIREKEPTQIKLISGFQKIVSNNPINISLDQWLCEKISAILKWGHKSRGLSLGLLMAMPEHIFMASF